MDIGLQRQLGKREELSSSRFPKHGTSLATDEELHQKIPQWGVTRFSIARSNTKYKNASYVQRSQEKSGYNIVSLVSRYLSALRVLTAKKPGVECASV